VAADYTRVIVFKVEDQAIKRATDRITRSLEGIEKTLGRIEQKGFGKIAKEADVAAKSIDKLSKSAKGWKGLATQLTTTKGGVRTMGVGVLGAGMGANWMKNQIGGIKSAVASLNPFNKATEVAAAKTGALSAGLTKLSAIASGHPVTVAAMAVAYMAFGDQLLNVTKKGIFGLLNGLGKVGQGATNSAALAIGKYKNLETQFELTSAAAARLNAQIQSPRGRIGPKNRAFGVREQGTSIEESVRTRNRAINQRAAEHREARMIADGPYKSGWSPSLSRSSRQAIRLDAEFKNLPTVKAVRNLEAIEKKRLLIARRHLRANEKLVTIGLNRQEMGIVTPGRNANTITGFTANQYGPQPAPLNRMQRWGIGNGANSKGWAASPGGIGGRWKGAAQSGMIGGGFPLLFGQSPGAAVAGGVGGALGGALSPGFGFAGSIVATAAAQKIGEVIAFRKSVADLNKEIRFMGLDAEFSAGQIAKLGKTLGVTKQEALEIAKGFKRYGGKKGGLFAEFFGDSQLLGVTAGARDIESAIAAIKAHSGDMTTEEELRYRIKLQTQGVEETINALVEKRIKRSREAFEEQQKNEKSRESAKNLSYWGGMSYESRSFVEQQQKDLEAQIEKEKELIVLFEQEREVRDGIALAAERQAQSIAVEVEVVEKELRKLNNTQYQVVELSRQIGSSFSESFKGIINGTMSVQQAFANMFSRIADHFLDMAARMAAAQLQKGILQMFMPAPIAPVVSGFSAGGLGSKMGSGFFSGSGANTGGLSFGKAAGISGKAAGGPVSGGSPYIVGEKGPELFVPGSHGSIVPNDQMGGSNIIVNVDASGSSVEGDEEQGRELGNMLAAAIQAELVRQKRPGGLLV
tara:strand:- start:729 stop:3314 length:2586 start_codon:yes stop_codon:yes gene_type:complete